MIEVLFLVIIVVLLVLIFFGLSAMRDRRMINTYEKEILATKEKIRIAERKYMNGKIRKNIFDSLADDLEEELFSKELELFRLKKDSFPSVESKADLILAKMSGTNKHKRAQVEKILKETELLREEMSMLESKFLRHEIKQSVFEKLIKTKEAEMIRYEQALTQVVLSSRDFSDLDKKSSSKK